MKSLIFDLPGAVNAGAEQVKRVLNEKPGALLAISAGRSTKLLCERLSEMFREGELSLRDARLFAVTELEGVNHVQSCRHFLTEELIERTDFRPENCTFLSGENLEKYDDMIALAGGIDLAVLGLGDNAHIGYNEPATPFDSLSHRQKLTDATRRQLAGQFGGEDQTPEFALTMGIKTLVSAREILVLAFGEKKAEPVFKMFYARNDSAVPAAFLQLPFSVTVCLDSAAAAKL